MDTIIPEGLVLSLQKKEINPYRVQRTKAISV